jgi:hypothetical protein
MYLNNCIALMMALAKLAKKFNFPISAWQRKIAVLASKLLYLGKFGETF